MKIEQKAIEEIQNQFKCIEIDYTNNKDVTAIAVVHGEMAEAVIKALKKQIPKGFQSVKDNQFCCPNCHSRQPYIDHTIYCGDCGQCIKE